MSTRLHYLDALRSFCMLYGILVHAGTLNSAHGLSRTVFTSSDHFRMATFFLISGFFAVMVLNKRGTLAFWKHRALALLLPLAVALVLLNPPTNWLIQKADMPELGFVAFLTGDHGPLPAPVNWHLHLWFLFSLAIYVALLPAVLPLLRRLEPAANRLARGQADMVVLALAVIATLGEMAGRVVYGTLAEPVVDGTPVAWLCRGTLQYLPWFLIGALSFFSRPLFEAMHRLSWPALGLAGALQIGLWLVPLDGGARVVFEVIAEEMTTFAIAAALFALFRRALSGPSRIVTALNDAVYSVYLFHFLFIYTLGLFVFPDSLPFVLRFGLVCLGTFVAGFALHHGVIARIPLLRLLFNGKAGLSRPATSRA